MWYSKLAENTKSIDGMLVTSAYKWRRVHAIYSISLAIFETLLVDCVRFKLAFKSIARTTFDLQDLLKVSSREKAAQHLHIQGQATVEL